MMGEGDVKALVNALRRKDSSLRVLWMDCSIPPLLSLLAIPLTRFIDLQSFVDAVAQSNLLMIRVTSKNAGWVETRLRHRRIDGIQLEDRLSLLFCLLRHTIVPIDELSHSTASEETR